MISVNGQHKIPTGGIYDADIAGVVHDAVSRKNVAVFVRNESPVRYAALNEGAESVLCHKFDQQLAGGRADLIREGSGLRTASALVTLIDIGQQSSHFSGRGL